MITDDLDNFGNGHNRPSLPQALRARYFLKKNRAHSARRVRRAEERKARKNAKRKQSTS